MNDDETLKDVVKLVKHIREQPVFYKTVQRPGLWARAGIVSLRRLLAIEWKGVMFLLT